MTKSKGWVVRIETPNILDNTKVVSSWAGWGWSRTFNKTDAHKWHYKKDAAEEAGLWKRLGYNTAVERV